MSASYQASIVSLSVVETHMATGNQFTLELSGQKTPQVYAFDGVSVGMQRCNAGAGAPDVEASEPVQTFNAVVTSVAAQQDAPLTVNVTLLGAAPSLKAYVGDEVNVYLVVVSSTHSPETGAPPAPPPTEPGGELLAPFFPTEEDASGHEHQARVQLHQTW